MTKYEKLHLNPFNQVNSFNSMMNMLFKNQFNIYLNPFNQVNSFNKEGFIFKLCPNSS